MQIEIAPQQRMSETGSSLLRLIQNNEMPLWDLLVREAVQNSLDAALDATLDGEDYVQVDFSIRDFRRGDLAEHFEGIREQMNMLFPEETYKLLEIRDTCTVGLTGPLQETNIGIRNYGNLIKLVYHVGMPQQKEGAGGSWGLGKTVYYRIGIGLVVFYSRIYEEGRYMSRLAACLVEDEGKEQALLKGKGNHRGIAWWGKKTGDGETTVALTDEEEILEVLKALGVKPFDEDQTGTVVVIPFLKNDLRQIQGDVDDENETGNVTNPWWNEDDADYIRIALQKWYAPRLMNKQYRHGRWLKASVNGQVLEPEDFLPVFRLIQNLYNGAVSAGIDGRIEVDGLVSSLNVSQINLRGNFIDGSIAGWVAFGRFSAKELKMLPPDNNYSPWIQIFGRELGGDSNPPIVCFTRKPGMIVGYEFVGKWTDGIARTSRNEYTIGIFVANSANRLKEDFRKDKNADFTLEEYIRGCEKADHAAWQDWVPGKKNPLIIEKVQRQVARIIDNRFKTVHGDSPPAKNVVLGRLLANAILPPEGFGRMANVQKMVTGNHGDGTSSRKSTNMFLEVSPPSYDRGLPKIGFRFGSGTSSGTFVLKLGAVTENGNIDSDTWEDSEKGTGTPFPVRIVRFEMDSADMDGPAGIGWNVADGVTRENGMRMCGIVNTTSFGTTVGFMFSAEAKREYTGTIWIESMDPLIHIYLFAEPVLEAVGT